ncbi:F-box LRR-repeat 2 [Paramuricea clavata]|uniref:F-box LRR-repeat 2 n=1 Tax=Paramuricea clavata TaxID=317549 RepID=A0A7D9DE18_PARCT|nr:F-box LRR-repeat 2 [Paramuricea clavata]
MTKVYYRILILFYTVHSRFNFLVERNVGLQKIRLPNQGNCKRMLDTITKNCHHVTELALQDAIDEDRLLLDDDTFRRFAERFPMLRMLDLTWCCHITDKSLEYIARNCSELRYLHIRECPMITDEGIRSIAKRCHFLDDLHLERQTLVNNDCCYAIRDHLHYMTSLGLIDTCVTDLGIDVITTSAENLRALRIGENCFRPQNIKGVCLNSIAQKCNRLEKLHVFSIKMDDTNLVPLCQNLAELRELHLGACGRVSRTGIQELTEKCGKLTELRLYGCPSFRDCHLDIMASKMPELRRLEIFGCNKITEDGASKFGEKRPDCFLNV